MQFAAQRSTFRWRRAAQAVCVAMVVAGLMLGLPAVVVGQTAVETPPTGSLSELADVRNLVEPGKISGTLQAVLLVAVVSLVPAVALMTTSFVRIVIVLGILRQAIGAQQIPSPQILTALALFMSFLIMAPVWQEVKTQAVDPYVSGESEMTFEEAWQAAVRPVRGFMSRQIAAAGNAEDVRVFYEALPQARRSEPPKTWEEVPLEVLLPAFLISELKIAFLIGFQIFMPFLVVDLVVASVTTSLGMVMLPPATISLPLKLALFVLADGWNLVVGMLLQSFSPWM